jgi:hypothetical protein
MCNLPKTLPPILLGLHLLTALSRHKKTLYYVSNLTLSGHVVEN